MHPIILAKGNECTKTVGGQKVQVVPFVGVDDEDKMAFMRVGVLYVKKNEAQLSEIEAKLSFMRSWRGMKILQEAAVITPHTLSACWCAGGHIQSDLDLYLFRHLKREYENEARLIRVRDLVLDSSLSEEEVQRLDALFQQRRLPGFSHEVNLERAAGRIPLSLTVQNVLRRDRLQLAY